MLHDHRIGLQRTTWACTDPAVLTTRPGAAERLRDLQSGRPDSNRRPPEPHSGALPSCATSRACNTTKVSGGRVPVPEPHGAPVVSRRSSLVSRTAETISEFPDGRSAQVRYRAAPRPENGQASNCGGVREAVHQVPVSDGWVRQPGLTFRPPSPPRRASPCRGRH
jgi:hypothetical protein